MLHGYRLEGIQMEPEITRFIDEIRDLMEYIPLPKELADIPFFDIAARPDVPKDEEGSPLQRHQNILPLLPLHPDLSHIQSKLRVFADEIIQHVPIEKEDIPDIEEPLEMATTAIQNLLLLIIGENIRKVDQHPLIRVNASDPEKHCSMNELRQIVRDVRKDIDDDQIGANKATLELLIRLGAIEREEIQNPESKERLLEKIREAKKAALDYYAEIGERLGSVQMTEFQIPGKEIHVDLSAETRTLSLFGMLDYTVHGEDGLSLADYSEIQSIAYLTYLFFMVQNNPLYKKAKRFHNAVLYNFTKEMFRSKGPYARLYKDNLGNVTSEKTENYKEYQMRKIELDSGVIDVWFKGIEVKGEDSTVGKQLLRPYRNIENTPDLLRGRIVVWDIGRESMDQPQTLDLLTKVAEKAGQALGIKNPIISNNFNGSVQEHSHSSDEFRMVKVEGTIEGVPVEFQILPRCTLEAMESRKSPSSDEYYALEKILDIAQTLFTESTDPNIHRVAIRARKALKRRKAAGLPYYTRTL